ncbi:MAG: hypothetical protein ACPIOQ_19215, partial [Promethearchaeia archaeon]
KEPFSPHDTHAAALAAAPHRSISFPLLPPSSFPKDLAGTSGTWTPSGKSRCPRGRWRWLSGRGGVDDPGVRICDSGLTLGARREMMETGQGTHAHCAS